MNTYYYIILLFKLFTGSRALKDLSNAVKDDLCSLCNGTCGSNSTKERYYGYEGAFICMAEGNKDRVGFVKQTTADSVFTMYPGKYGNRSDYELLCTDGTRKGHLIKYNICKILLLKYALHGNFYSPPVEEV